jgi:hypothetical protein
MDSQEQFSSKQVGRLVGWTVGLLARFELAIGPDDVLSHLTEPHAIVHCLQLMFGSCSYFYHDHMISIRVATCAGAKVIMPK